MKLADIKAAKAEILRTAAKEDPPASLVAQDDIMDMMLKAYFDPAARAPQEMTLGALVAGSQMAKDGAEITLAQVKAILDKYKP